MVEKKTLHLNLKMASPPEAQISLLRDLLAELCVGAVGPKFPIVAPAMLLSDDRLRDVNSIMCAMDGKSVLHETQTFVACDIGDFDQSWEVEVNCEQIDNKVVLDCNLQVGKLATGKMLTRLRFVSPEEIRAIKGTAFSDRLNTPDTRWSETPHISEVFVQRYLELSGDKNPIHTDGEAACAAGFGAAVIPGMLFCAMSETMAGQMSVGTPLREMRTRFLSAVEVGEAVRVGVTPLRENSAGGLAAARVYIVARDGTLAAISDLKYGQ